MLDLPFRENCVFGYAVYNGGVGWVGGYTPAGCHSASGQTGLVTQASQNDGIISRFVC